MSEKHQGALAKQIEANKVLDNDLKMMYVCFFLNLLTLIKFAQVPQAQERHFRAGRQVQTRRLWPSLRVRHLFIHSFFDSPIFRYAISRLDRCEGLLQEWGSYVQTAASTARAMDEVTMQVSICGSRFLTMLDQVAAEHKKSEVLVTRIITAAVQRARNLDSTNQSLAEQLQRARSDIAQVA
jgi:hypothetical protein